MDRLQKTATCLSLDGIDNPLHATCMKLTHANRPSSKNVVRRMEYDVLIRESRDDTLSELSGQIQQKMSRSPERRILITSSSHQSIGEGKMFSPLFAQREEETPKKVRKVN